MIGQMPKEADTLQELAISPADSEAVPEQAREFGGRDGPEPTRYGDWEKNGRCIDF